MFTLPDIGVGENDLQSVVFASYVSALVAGIDGTDCVLSGGAVTAQGSPDMTVAVAKAAILSNQVLLPVTAGNVTVTTADGTNPRLDLIVANSSGTKAIRTGTAAAAPKAPARSANDVVLAVVYVPAGATTITTARIYDLRVTRTVGPITLAKLTTALQFDTTNAIQTYFSAVIPNGLLVAGRIIRVSCGGYYASNSGSPTWTLTLGFGGTMFADVTPATTANANSGAWRLDFDLIAATSSQQFLVGLLAFQTPGGKTAPTTGIGDLAVLTHVIAPLRGLVSSSADAADNTLSVQFTMSVSNAAVFTVINYATAELI